jgi:hypothetical protein
MRSNRNDRARNAGSISFRQNIVGGLLTDDDGVIDPPDLLVDNDRILILVHGFNVNQAEADRSYALFESRLSDEVRERVVRLYWPGDTATAADMLRGDRGQISAALSALAYIVKPPVAMRSSQKLRNLFQRIFGERRAAGRNQPLEICIVAHSLGCRLALETLERVVIASNTDARLPLTVLMAAAVPTYMVTGTGTLAEVVGKLPLWILHSTDDTVLQRWFRPGQISERAAFPNFRLSVRGALGRKGIPGSSTLRVLEGQWDHGDYWPDQDIAEAVDAELSDRRCYSQAFEVLERKIWERRVSERRIEARETLLPSHW